MADLSDFGLLCVTGRIYLRHRWCGETEVGREITTAADVLLAANAHSCPEEVPWDAIVEGSVR